jgi:hypothetical protein
MWKYSSVSWVIVAFCCLACPAVAEMGSGMPLKYISSCELDLNNDEQADIALLLETTKGRELIVLLAKSNGYEAYLLMRGNDNMHLSCHFGKSVKETCAAGGTGRVYETPGTYIQLTQPEGSSVAFFWERDSFRKVWTSD